VGVFDTSYYSEMQDYAYIYPIPYELYEKHKIRRYGFHGTSHRFVAGKAAELLGKKDAKIITCHLGNGSSITATVNGKAIDTSMGFTPQDGVPMGTRSGALDPTVPTFIMKAENLTVEQTEKLLNSQSGLLGVSGISSDCRDVWAAAKAGNKRAKLAIDILVHNAKKIIGSYMAEMNGCDVLVFTAGIGENQDKLRAELLEKLAYLGVKLDAKANFAHGEEVEISTPDSAVRAFVIPTNEELVIARDTKALI
jgi:acetate kinase